MYGRNRYGTTRYGSTGVTTAILYAIVEMLSSAVVSSNGVAIANVKSFLGESNVS